ncbi:MAG: acyl-CoA dehydrogenase family protein [Promethearchaeota archaeon]
MNKEKKIMNAKVKIIPEEIEEKLSLENVYKLFNFQIGDLLSEQEFEFVKEFQKFNIENEPNIDFADGDSLYKLFPIYGKRGYIQRLNKWKDFEPHGCKFEMLLGINNSIMDPEFEMCRGASGILCANPTFQHGGTDALDKVQDGLCSGKKIGCIAMTEERHGTDVVNMKSHAERIDGGYKFTGTKIFTTNGPKADYFLGYGSVDNDKPRNTMVQGMLSRDMGITTERLNIPIVPRIHIGKTHFNGSEVPDDLITGKPGVGYRNLFDGLVPERLSITSGNLGVCWGALLNGIIYCNLRKQFGKPIINYQAVSFPLADLLIRVSSATTTALAIAEWYDKKILGDEKPSAEVLKASAQKSSQIKYIAAKLAGEVAYEVQQHMGGISVTDNTRLSRIFGVSNLQEVIAGSRGVQQLIISNNIKKMMRLL